MNVFTIIWSECSHSAVYLNGILAMQEETITADAVLRLLDGRNFEYSGPFQVDEDWLKSEFNMYPRMLHDCQIYHKKEKE